MVLGTFLGSQGLNLCGQGWHPGYQWGFPKVVGARGGDFGAYRILPEMDDLGITRCTF